MNTRHTLAGLGLTMGAAVAFAATALADSATPEPISAQVTKATSASRQTSSEVTVEGTWQTPHLTPGSVLTVGSVNGVFNWLANFPFTLNDGTRIGECVADQATLTCTVTDVPEAWAAKHNVTGTFHANARLVDKAVGTESTQITLNGQTLEATTTVKAGGGTDGDGTVKPTPTPKPTTQAPTPAPHVTTEPVPVPTHTKPAPQAQLAKTGATLDGIKVALAALALGVFLAACVYVSNRCGLGGEGR